MPLTERQRQRRTQCLGATDLAAILGVDPYRSAWDVWAEKTGRVERAEASPAAEAGSRFEAGVLSWAEERLGKLDRRGTERRVDGTPILVHVDAIVAATREPVEAKTAGLFGPLHGQWGAEGTDEIPDQYLIQCQAHLMATGADVCHVAAFLGGRGYVLYQVHRHEQLQEVIAERALAFWRDHVEADEPPEARPNLQVAKLLKRMPEKVADFGTDGQELVERWLQARDQRREAEKLEQEAQAALLAALGDAEAARLPDGRLLTFLEQKSRRIDTKRLKETHPEVAAEFTVETTYRVLRIKKGG